MSGAEEIPPEDGIDYGSGEGAAYGGNDGDAPIVILPSVHASTGEGKNGQHHSRDTKYHRYVFPRLWSGVAWLYHKVFSHSSAWNAIASVIIAISTIVYTVYAHRQWVAMSSQIVVSRQANELTQKALAGSDSSLNQTLQKMGEQTAQEKRLADASSGQLTELGNSVQEAGRLAKATEEANRNVVNADRPWMGGTISVTDLIADSQPKLTYNFQNSGRRPARVESLIGFGFTNPVFPIITGEFIKENATRATERSRGVVVPGNGFGDQNAPQAKVSFSDMRLIETGGLKYFAVASVVYEDLQTGESHYTHVCIYYIPQKPSGGKWEACKEYTDAN